MPTGDMPKAPVWFDVDILTDWFKRKFAGKQWFYHVLSSNTGVSWNSGKFLFNQIWEDKTTSRIGSNISYKTWPQSIPDCAQVEPQGDLGFRWPSLGLKNYGWAKLNQENIWKYTRKTQEIHQTMAVVSIGLSVSSCALGFWLTQNTNVMIDPWNCSDLSHPGTHDSPPWQVSSCHLGKWLQFKFDFQNQT